MRMSSVNIESMAVDSTEKRAIPALELSAYRVKQCKKEKQD